MAAVEVGAEEDRAARGSVVGMLGDPSLGGVAFAVLLLGVGGEVGGGGGIGWGAAELGPEGDDAVWPSATTAAETREWKYWGVLALPTWRVPQGSQWIL